VFLFSSKLAISNQQQKRGATVRVPKDAKVAVNVAVLSPEHFDKWDSFRNLLLVKTVPMIQMLPRKERQKILQNLSIKDFRDGDYIIRQGDVGKHSTLFTHILLAYNVTLFGVKLTILIAHELYIDS
jgi:hypothetical protein